MQTSGELVVRPVVREISTASDTREPVQIDPRQLTAGMSKDVSIQPSELANEPSNLTATVHVLQTTVEMHDTTAGVLQIESGSLPTTKRLSRTSEPIAYDERRRRRPDPHPVAMADSENLLPSSSRSINITSRSTSTSRLPIHHHSFISLNDNCSNSLRHHTSGSPYTSPDPSEPPPKSGSPSSKASKGAGQSVASFVGSLGKRWKPKILSRRATGASPHKPSLKPANAILCKKDSLNSPTEAPSDYGLPLCCQALSNPNDKSNHDPWPIRTSSDTLALPSSNPPSEFITLATTTFMRPKPTPKPTPVGAFNSNHSHSTLELTPDNESRDEVYKLPALPSPVSAFDITFKSKSPTRSRDTHSSSPVGLDSAQSGEKNTSPPEAVTPRRISSFDGLDLKGKGRAHLPDETITEPSQHLTSTRQDQSDWMAINVATDSHATPSDFSEFQGLVHLASMLSPTTSSEAKLEKETTRTQTCATVCSEANFDRDGANSDDEGRTRDDDQDDYDDDDLQTACTHISHDLHSSSAILDGSEPQAGPSGHLPASERTNPFVRHILPVTDMSSSVSGVRSRPPHPTLPDPRTHRPSSSVSSRPLAEKSSDPQQSGRALSGTDTPLPTIGALHTLTNMTEFPLPFADIPSSDRGDPTLIKKSASLQALALSHLRNYSNGGSQHQTVHRGPSALGGMQVSTSQTAIDRRFEPNASSVKRNSVGITPGIFTHTNASATTTSLNDYNSKSTKPPLSKIYRWSMTSPPSLRGLENSLIVSPQLQSASAHDLSTVEHPSDESPQQNLKDSKKVWPTQGDSPAATDRPVLKELTSSRLGSSHSTSLQ